MKCGLQLIIVLCTSVAWMANIVESDCCVQYPKVPTFQTCRYRCHCKNDAQCDKTSGVCHNGCEEGWMGPSCQYRNLASALYSTKEYTRYKNIFHLPSEYFDDYRHGWSDHLEHFSHHSLIVHFSEPHEVIGLIIKVPAKDVGKHFFRIETSQNPVDGLFPTVCYENSSINHTMEIMCRQSENAIQLKITLGELAVQVRLWDVEIYGGRSLAFNKPSEQGSAVITSRGKDKRNPCFAVDGNEHFQQSISPVCTATHGTEPWWRVDLLKPYRLNEIVIQNITPNYNLSSSRNLEGFYLLYGSNASSLITVFHDGEENGTDWSPNHHILVSLQVTGRYLQIELRRISKMILCEVFVFGECPKNKCGFDCHLDCFCATEVTGSYRENGICPYGCQDGWIGEGQRCDQEIVLGTRQSHSSTSCASSTVGVGVTMAIVIAVLIVVIIILIHRHQKYIREQEQRVTYTSVNHAVTPSAESTYDQLRQEPETPQPIPVYMELQ